MARSIATHAALDWMRAQRPESANPAEPHELAAPSGGDPAIAAEIRQRTAEAFGRLAPKLRIAATLAVVEELPTKR